MNCEVCDGSNFVTNDGIKYCSECHTQIEETQAEENVDFTIGKSSGSPASSRSSSTEKKRSYNNWITTECYNHILSMQVSALIKLGASQNLKITVMHIWSKYLQKCEIAFRTDYRKDGKPCLGPVPSKRDRKVLYGDKSISRHKRKLSETSLDSGTTSVYTTCSESDSVFDADSDKSEGESMIEEQFSSHAEKLFEKGKLKFMKSKKYYSKNIVFNVTLDKTISICYLALIYTEDKLSLLDLIRFAYEEKIPYLNIIDKLPSSLGLQDRDTTSLLVYRVPDAYSILKMSNEIATFLELPHFRQPSIFLAVSRFVKDFNLPDDIKTIVKTLIEQYEEQQNLENVPHDYQALAFIIVALKLLFVLDDEFEFEHSNVMNKLNAISKDHKFFEFKEWMEQSVIKEYLFLCENPGYCNINRLDSLSVDTIISKYSFKRLKPQGTENDSDDIVTKNNIMSILSNFVNIPSFNGNISTSFPLRSAVNSFSEEWKNLPMFKETQEIDFNFLKKDFSSHSLSFNPLKFDNDDRELSYVLLTSLYMPKYIITENYSYQQIIRTTSSYWFFKNVRTGKSNLASDWFEKLPNSFKWLIIFFSKYSYCNHITLYDEVIKIEKLLFLQ